MEFLKNQTLKSSVKFFNIEKPENKLSLSFTINCNHDINKDTVKEIENTINNMFLPNYKKIDDLKAYKADEKEKQKNEEEAKNNGEIENKKLLKRQEDIEKMILKKRLKIKNLI
jgi:hypothetical protein